MHVFLETDRLILRRFTVHDVDLLYALDSDPEVNEFLRGGATISREEIETEYIPAYQDYYRRFEGFGFWAAIERATGHFLGWFHLRPLRGEPEDQPEIGYRLHKSAWGKGYGTEGSRALIQKGFGEFGVVRVNAFAYEHNIGSRRVMEKSGMRLVRTFKPTAAELLEYLGVTDPSIYPGDDVEYAITKAEWEAQNSVS